MPSWIRDRSEDMLRRGTADIAVGTDEVRMNLIDASLKQSSQVEYVRVELIDAGYDIGTDLCEARRGDLIGREGLGGRGLMLPRVVA